MKQKIVNWLLIASLVSTSIPSVQVFADDSQTTEPPSTQETVTTESLSPWDFTSDTTTYEEPELVEEEISTTQTSDPSSSETSSTQETPQNTETFPSESDGFEDWSNPILFEKYITITEKESFVIYQSQELTEIVERKEVKNQTFFAKEQFELANGKIYVSLYNQAQQLIGYIENDAENKSLVFTENLQGTAKEYNHYIMVVETTEENKAYKDFTFTESFSIDELLNRTYFVKEHYYHFDGKEYLVLTDKKGATVAIIEQSLTVISPDAEGIAQDFDAYLTLNKDYPLWSSFNFKVKSTTKPYEEKILLAKEIYYHFDGSQYLAVYNNQDTLIGYVNAKGVDLYAGKLGAKKDFGKFVTISGTHPIWDNELKTSTPSTNYKNKTLEAKYVYANFDGTTYYALYNNQGKWIGNIAEQGVTVATGQQGIYQAYNKYVMLKGDYPIWTAFDWARSIDLTPYKNKTLEARGIYYHFNGSSYLSLYDNQGKWIGYMNAAGANVAPGQQGIYQAYNKYVMLKGDYAIWNGFDWAKSTSAAPYKNKTVQALGIYYHFNGSSYLSLYDNQGKWIGYMNAAGANVAPGQQGIYQAYNKYVMLKGDYAIWNGFDWAKSTSAAPYKNKTVQARGIYYHFNGSSYLSLYDNQGKWIGYMNAVGANVAPGQQGIYQAYNKYVMLKGDYAIWNGFDWAKSKSAAPYKNKTVQARGIYYHFNGSSYLSLYDNQGKWIGYMNAAGANVAPGQQGIYQTYNKYVTIKSNAYAIWKNFSWSSKASGSFSGQSYLAKGIYYHFNGSKYLSLYDNNNKWIGYINENGVDYRPVHLFVMGHGDTDPGAVGNGTNERDFTRRELLPYLQKYANQLKNNHIIFYDTSRNLYKETKSGDGLYDIYYGLSSITEIHLDAGIQNIGTGGHVIVSPGKSNYTQDLALAAVVGKYNSIWRNTASSAGLSYRTDLLNLNVSKKVDVSYRLVELGFITNQKDLALLRANLDKIAKEFVQIVTGEKL
ncbi:N-acetylmuramoyl-L-alanine amidase [Enterococcus sp. DIV1314a]|uniref:N-acetylmuramoyl-L-alanine amidase n=1 Tax=Enterococcus sp. DIV1314a TaxID=2774660 RepID=UPI003F26C1BF